MRTISEYDLRDFRVCHRNSFLLSSIESFRSANCFLTSKTLEYSINRSRLPPVECCSVAHSGIDISEMGERRLFAEECAEIVVKHLVHQLQRIE